MTKLRDLVPDGSRESSGAYAAVGSQIHRIVERQANATRALSDGIARAAVTNSRNFERMVRHACEQMVSINAPIPGFCSQPAGWSINTLSSSNGQAGAWRRRPQNPPKKANRLRED